MDEPSQPSSPVPPDAASRSVLVTVHVVCFSSPLQKWKPVANRRLFHLTQQLSNSVVFKAHSHSSRRRPIADNKKTWHLEVYALIRYALQLYLWSVRLGHSAISICRCRMGRDTAQKAVCSVVEGAVRTRAGECACVGVVCTSRPRQCPQTAVSSEERKPQAQQQERRQTVTVSPVS